MAHSFLDTNLFIRYITQDNPRQSQQAKQLFDQIKQGLVTVTTSEAVISECVYVLASKALYHLPREQISTALTLLLSLKGLKLTRKRIYVRALSLYAASNLDFVDALIATHMEQVQISTLWSFDRGFDHLPGIVRQEPELPEN
jgi:predicted nucleic acid-binding protein